MRMEWVRESERVDIFIIFFFVCFGNVEKYIAAYKSIWSKGKKIDLKANWGKKGIMHITDIHLFLCLSVACYFVVVVVFVVVPFAGKRNTFQKSIGEIEFSQLKQRRFFALVIIGKVVVFVVFFLSLILFLAMINCWGSMHLKMCPFCSTPTAISEPIFVYRAAFEIFIGLWMKHRNLELASF